jgi:Fe-S-cluster containining protein
VQKGSRRFYIPTLVPARRADGACLYLSEDNRCTIHSVAPYGCAFFDAHLPHFIADVRSSKGLEAIMLDQQRNGLYSRVWALLDREGLRAPSPMENRQRMAQALAR